MKKLLFSAVTLDVGGIETALVRLLNYLADQKNNGKYKYEITLVLEKKQGLFLHSLDSRIKIIEYAPSNDKIVFIRKATNFLKQQLFKFIHGNKYDFSCSYATYSNSGAFVARTASRNSTLWCHMDYLAMFGENENKVKEFFEEKQYDKFKNIVFVSERSKETFLHVFPNARNKTIHINNWIDYNKILDLAEEKASDLQPKEDVTTFINIGRHYEDQKKLSRILEAAKILKDENKKFRIVFVGDGRDTKQYYDLVRKYDLKEYVIFLDRKKNPYPYLKMSDCTILTSDYEGYPVVFVESMVLNKPIITTNVSGVEAIEQNGYAIVTEKDAESIAFAMKTFIEEGFEIQNKFDAQKYDDEITEKLEKLMN